MSAIATTGKKTNHKKGIAAKAKARRRDDAEAHQAAYAKVPSDVKFAKAGEKERAKLVRKVAA